MSSTKLDILWSPRHGDDFVTYGTDVKLYHFDAKVRRRSAHESGDDNAFQMITSNSEVQYLKCVSWSWREDYDSLLALGQQNGKVLLTNFNQQQDPIELVGKEFIPRHSRQLNCLAWNPIDKNLLAAGLEKTRNECSLLIWDVEKSPALSQVDADRRSLGGAYDNQASHTRPISELGLNETTHSVHWLVKESKTLITGMNNKYLKIYDLRENGGRHSAATLTKAVHGVCADIFHTNWVASYYEHQMMIWDIRSFEKPMITLNDTQPISKIAWCPTRANLLASVSRDSHAVKLYDIHLNGIGSDELEPTIVERSVAVPGGHSVASFAWHPTKEVCITTVNSVGSFYHESVCERITLNWSPNSKLVWSHGKKILQYIDQSDEVYSSFEDISSMMRQRATNGYGVDPPQLKRNNDVVKNDAVLQNLWNWLELLRSVVEEEKAYKSAREARENKEARESRDAPESKPRTVPTVPVFTSQVGVLSFIRNSGGSAIRSEPQLLIWEGTQDKTATKIYKSWNRDRALQLCNWNFNNEGINVVSLLDRLEAEGCYQRAATIAVFNSKIRKAIKILKKGASASVPKDESLYMVSIGLSGYNPDKTSFWRENCDTLRTQLHDPYLRAMFAFLTCDDDSYEDVLNESGVCVQDRVAFACLFLPDNKLNDYLEGLIANMAETGSLDGILLTGLGKEGIDLLQRFVDTTGDIQTASLVVVQSLPSAVGSDPRALQWIEGYRQMLDNWRLWMQRALFDVNWHKTDALYKPSPQVYASCNFCSKPIAAIMQRRGPLVTANYGGSASNKTKFTCCPNCRKPLPRCALCLNHMGTPTAVVIPALPEEHIVTEEQKRQRISLFGDWFTWCQTCRHGGHSHHMTSWFNEHPECPVTACNCKCMSLD